MFTVAYKHAGMCTFFFEPKYYPVPFREKDWKEKTCVSNALSFLRQKDAQEIDHQQEQIPHSATWNSKKKYIYFWQENSNFDPTSKLEGKGWPELLTIVIIAKHNNFTRNLFKVITYFHASFTTFLAVVSIYFN